MADIVIIGAGPAGASAAIFTAKAGKSTVLIDSDQSVTKRAWIENHYGAPNTTGPDLVEIGKKQAVQHGAQLVADKVTDVQKNGDGFVVTTESGASYEAAHVVFATGMITELAGQVGVALKDGTEPRIKTIIDCDATGRTSIDGIWAAGTVAGVSMHTIITAGDGAKVAINIVSELNGARYVDHDVMKA